MVLLLSSLPSFFTVLPKRRNGAQTENKKVIAEIKQLQSMEEPVKLGPLKLPMNTPAHQKSMIVGYLSFNIHYSLDASCPCTTYTSPQPPQLSNPNSGLVANYCRNPDNEPAAWCYTMDNDTRWEVCGVPQCPG